MKIILRLSGLVLISLFAIAIHAQDAVDPNQLDLSGTPEEICDAATPAIEPDNRSYEAAEQVLEADVDYRAILCTDAGAIYLDLLEDYTPLTVNNFVFLAQNNYYNNTIFHRVIPDFMAQGGDPTGTGSGGPGYQFADEPVGFLIFDRPGLFAMANAGPGTNGSQFFITTVPTPHLDYKHTIFGAVLEGDATAIEVRDPQVPDAPATALQAVVIIDDPDAVTSDYQNPLETANADFFIENLNIFGTEGGLPPELVEGYEAPAALATEDMIAAIPEALQEDFAALLEDNGHDFTIKMALGNPSCAPGYFDLISYQVDAYESAEAASTVLASDTFANILDEQSFEAVDMIGLSAGVYQVESESPCSDEAGLLVRAYFQRGRYIASIDGLFPADIIAEATSETIAFATANQMPQVFEAILTDAYRAELP